MSGSYPAPDAELSADAGSANQEPVAAKKKYPSGPSGKHVTQRLKVSVSLEEQERWAIVAEDENSSKAELAARVTSVYVAQRLQDPKLRAAWRAAYRKRTGENPKD